MKRSQMKRKITHLLKNWRGSILDGDTSEEILKLFESNIDFNWPSENKSRINLSDNIEVTNRFEPKLKRVKVKSWEPR